MWNQSLSHLQSSLRYLALSCFVLLFLELYSSCIKLTCSTGSGGPARSQTIDVVIGVGIAISMAYHYGISLLLSLSLSLSLLLLLLALLLMLPPLSIWLLSVHVCFCTKAASRDCSTYCRSWARCSRSWSRSCCVRWARCGDSTWAWLAAARGESGEGTLSLTLLSVDLVLQSVPPEGTQLEWTVAKVSAHAVLSSFAKHAAAYAEHTAAIQRKHDLQQQEENLVRARCPACRNTLLDQALVCKMLWLASVACSEQSVMCHSCVLYCCLVLYLLWFAFPIVANTSAFGPDIPEHSEDSSQR